MQVYYFMQIDLSALPERYQKQVLRKIAEQGKAKAPPAPQNSKKSKYHNIKTVQNGIRFDSKKRGKAVPPAQSHGAGRGNFRPKATGEFHPARGVYKTGWGAGQANRLQGRFYIPPEGRRRQIYIIYSRGREIGAHQNGGLSIEAEIIPGKVRNGHHRGLTAGNR